MTIAPFRVAAVCLALVLVAGASTIAQPGAGQEALRADQPKESTLRVQYLEIVTPSVDETCDVLAKAHGVTFSEPIAEFGNARTSELKGGGRIGVRAPITDGDPRPG
jgi:hypothetical protein